MYLELVLSILVAEVTAEAVVANTVFGPKVVAAAGTAVAPVLARHSLPVEAQVVHPSFLDILVVLL